ncbi:MAG: 2-oxo acid dehydrogenase subunit E2 [Clostridia bacterium]|nr:2-oxo acid dehydrogenase subunit E2 [Clostridia bacterium]
MKDTTEQFGIARKIVANMTTESWETIPHVAITYEPEIAEFLRILAELNNDKDKHITLNSAILRVIVEGLKFAPRMNSTIAYKRHLVRGVLTVHEQINVSMPVILSSGDMMTVNMRDLGNKTMTEIRDSVSDTMRRAMNTNLDEVMYEVSIANTLSGLKRGKLFQTIARLVGSRTGKNRVKVLHGKEKRDYYSIPQTERLTKSDIEQGTITVSNMGSLNRNWRGKCTLLEIVPPQTVAIALGSVQNTPVVGCDGKIIPGKVLPMTIVFDHRALDTADIMPFLNRLDSVFCSPAVIKEWV